MALIVTVLMLALIGVLGLSSLDIVTAERQVAGYQLRRSISLEAAEAGVATATGTIRSDLDTIRGSGVASLGSYNPAFPAVMLGDAASFPHGRPSFSADPDAPSAIAYIGRGETCDWLMSLEESVVWQETLWDVRVRGQSGDGTTTDIETVASVCKPFNTSY